MKIKGISVIMLLSLFVFSSCEDWLDVTPHGSMREDAAYSTKRATESALNGLYLNLTSDNLYGKTLSCEMLEILVRHYLNAPGHVLDYMANHRYTDDAFKSRLSNTWKTAYQTIAYANEFLTQVEKRQAQYTDLEYAMYRGEALAVRTLLHFDMLRLFGPIYAEDKDQKAIPYSSSSTNAPQEILTAEEIMEKLMKDITDAIELLQEDPILEVGVNELLTDVDFLSSFRSFRMNLYAAYFLKARMALYTGDHETAYGIANDLLAGSHSAHFNSTFSFMKAISESGEYEFFPEQVFCSHNSRRNNLQRNLFASSLPASGILAGGSAYLNKLYSDPATIGGMDGGIRPQIWEAGQGEMMVSLRYDNTYINPHYPYRVEIQSMMRLGELYLIAAEAAPDVESKRSWLEKLRVNRNFSPGNADGLSEDALNQLIEHEFIKETYGDGQYFYFAKRKFVKSFVTQEGGSYSMNKDRYMPPLPDGEINYRYSGDELIND